MVTHAPHKLFTAVQVGAIMLKHRVVMPPLSRLRAKWPSGVPSDLNLEYYSQRASDGGLIFTEATAVSSTGRGYRGAPGIYTDEQVAGWKRITDAVHATGTPAARRTSRRRARNPSRHPSIRPIGPIRKCWS
jgi:N-ethylmaleimide reductase